MKYNNISVITVLFICICANEVYSYERDRAIENESAINILKGFVDIVVKREIDRGLKDSAACDLTRSELLNPYRIKYLTTSMIIDNVGNMDLYQIAYNTKMLCFPVIACGEIWAQMEILWNGKRWVPLKFGGGGKLVERIIQSNNRLRDVLREDGLICDNEPVILWFLDIKVPLLYTRCIDGDRIFPVLSGDKMYGIKNERLYTANEALGILVRNSQSMLR